MSKTTNGNCKKTHRVKIFFSISLLMKNLRHRGNPYQLVDRRLIMPIPDSLIEDHDIIIIIIINEIYIALNMVL